MIDQYKPQSNLRELYEDLLPPDVINGTNDDVDKFLRLNFAKITLYFGDSLIKTLEERPKFTVITNFGISIKFK